MKHVSPITQIAQEAREDAEVERSARRLLRANLARLVTEAFVVRAADLGEVSIAALNRLRLPVVAVLHDDAAEDVPE